jgi:L-threonate 2-dehydrogenase
MMLAATRAGTAEALKAELSGSQPALYGWLTGQMPKMYSKAYRWVAEMEEIAAFLDGDGAAQEIYRGMARLYERLAQGATTPGEGEIKLIAEFSRKAAAAKPEQGTRRQEPGTIVT